MVEGKLAALGFEQRLELAAEAWSQEAVATAAIESDRLDLAAVRSSVARRLGISMGMGMGKQDGPSAPRHVEGLLESMDDAVTRCADEMTHERLHAWQAALFPTGYSGMTKIRVGGYREHAEAMQIVSGRLERERVHCPTGCTGSSSRARSRVRRHPRRLTTRWPRLGSGWITATGT